jgi:hypothetical protein
MYETDISIVRKTCVDKIFELMTYENDKICHHDDFAFCPANLCRMLNILNIYPIDFFERIRDYIPPTDEENPTYSFRIYWEHFVSHIVLDANDFQIWKEE